MPTPLLGHVLQDWAHGGFHEGFTPVFTKPRLCAGLEAGVQPHGTPALEGYQ